MEGAEPEGSRALGTVIPAEITGKGRAGGGEKSWGARAASSQEARGLEQRSQQGEKPAFEEPGCHPGGTVKHR